MPKRFDQTTNATAVAATDHVPFITAGAVTSYVTGDELASSAPFSSRYVPTSNDAIWMSPDNFSAVWNSPAIVIQSSTPTWHFDASTGEEIAGVVIVPNYWTAFHVDLYWSNVGVGAGDVRWELYAKALSDTDLLSEAVSTVGTATVTAPAQNVIKVTRLTSSSVATTSGDMRLVWIARVPTHAGDTLANDASVIGVRLVRAS